MSRIPPEHLAALTQGQWVTPEPEALVAGFCMDTRVLRPGQGFIALHTAYRDGHDYLRSAMERGASMALVSRPVEGVPLPQLVVDDPLRALHRIATAWRQAYEGPVVGITGSCGKTSTKDLLTVLLGRDRVLATPRNLNNSLGVPMTLCSIDPERHEAAIVEAGISEPGEMEKLARMIAPDIGIITMVGRAHLEKLGSLEGVAREKSLMGQHTRQGGHVLFPASCCEYDSFISFKGRSLVLVPDGEDMLCQNPEEVIPYEYTAMHEGCRELTLWRNARTPSRYRVPDWGPGMMSNAALALVTASLLGATDEHLQEALESWQPSSQRAQWLEAPHAQYFLDCYNANPESYAEAFTHFRAQSPEHKRLYVLGCMKELGEDAAQLHYETGLLLKMRGQDMAIVIGEYDESMRSGILDAGARESQVKCIQNMDTARDFVAAFQGMVLLKGSRAYALENLLPDLVSTHQSEEVAC